MNLTEVIINISTFQLLNWSQKGYHNEGWYSMQIYSLLNIGVQRAKFQVQQTFLLSYYRHRNMGSDREFK